MYAQLAEVKCVSRILKVSCSVCMRVRCATRSRTYHPRSLPSDLDPRRAGSPHAILPPRAPLTRRRQQGGHRERRRHCRRAGSTRGRFVQQRGRRCRVLLWPGAPTGGDARIRRCDGRALRGAMLPRQAACRRRRCAARPPASPTAARRPGTASFGAVAPARVQRERLGRARAAARVLGRCPHRLLRRERRLPLAAVGRRGAAAARRRVAGRSPGPNPSPSPNPSPDYNPKPLP